MPGRRRQSKTCRRKACSRPREGFRFLCDHCWGLVPGWLRAAIGKARHAGDTEQANALRLQACAEVDRIESDAPATPATQTYANTARLLGERDEQEAAE